MMRKNWRNLLVIGVITVAGLVFFCWKANPAMLLAACKTAHIGWILCAVAAMFCCWLLESGALYQVSKALYPKMTFFSSWRTTMVGQFFNGITPFASGGQPMQAYCMKKDGVPLGTATSALLTKFLVYQTTLTIFSIIAMIRFPFFTSKILGFGLLVGTGFLINTIVAALLILASWKPDFLMKLAHLLLAAGSKLKLVKRKEQLTASFSNEIEGFKHCGQYLWQHKIVLLQITFYTILQLLFFFLVPCFLCLAFGIGKSNLFTIFAAGAFVHMVSCFVPIPGASGGAEGCFLLFFSIFCPESGIIGLIIIMWRMLTFYLPTASGMLVFQLVPHRKELLPEGKAS